MAESDKYIGANPNQLTPGDFSEGKNYLLVIGIDKYQHLPPLFNCRKDAETFTDLLLERYRFSEDQLVRVFDADATQPKIFEAFYELIEKVTPQDNVLIYYSGHGEFDAKLDEGYWIPVDAHQGEFTEYMSNDVIRRFISRINSRHTFLVSDSCFAGSLFASGTKNVSKRYERDPSRWGLTAGRKEIVSDGKPGMHSPFADALLYRLRSNDGDLGVQELCAYIVEQVEANANQSPIGEPLKVEGHRNGQFVFHLRMDEEDYWKLALKEDRIETYLKYLDRYPQGRYQPLAEKRISEMEDERDWARTLRKNTILAFREYKQQHDTGKYLREAEAEIQKLLGKRNPQPTVSAPLAEPPKIRIKSSAKPPPAANNRLKYLLIAGGSLVAIFILWRIIAGVGGSKSPDWVCEKSYEECIPSSDGTYYLVREGDLWGFSPKDGKKQIRPAFEEVTPFDGNGYALVKKDGKYGWIDGEGVTVIPFEYDKAIPFLDGQARVSQGSVSFAIDIRGQKIGGGLEEVLSEIGGASWDRLVSAADLSYEAISSAIPELGIRGRYAILMRKVNPAILETLTGQAVFLSGPHQGDRADWNSGNSFGRYNPAFLQKLNTVLSAALSDPALVRKLQPLYNKEFRKLLQIYYRAYRVGANNKEVMSNYQEMVLNAGSADRAPGDYLQSAFRNFAGKFSGDQAEYVAIVAPGFWVRRSIDGTEDEFYRLLELVMGTFDPQFLRENPQR